MKKTEIKRKPSTLVRKPIQKKAGSALRGAKTPLGASKGKKTGKVSKRRKKTYADLKREWLVPANGYTRFSGLRGIYWYWLSRDIRQKEWEKYGHCITCLVPMETWEEGVCGHIIASQNCGEYLRLNPINLTIQHRACNSDRVTPQAAALNAIHYDQRHGQGAWATLYSLRKTEAKNPGQEELRRLIQGLDSYKMAQNKALLLSPGTEE